MYDGRISRRVSEIRLTAGPFLPPFPRPEPVANRGGVRVFLLSSRCSRVRLLEKRERNERKPQSPEELRDARGCARHDALIDSRSPGGDFVRRHPESRWEIRRISRFIYFVSRPLCSFIFRLTREAPEYSFILPTGSRARGVGAGGSPLISAVSLVAAMFFPLQAPLRSFYPFSSALCRVYRLRREEKITTARSVGG